MQLWGGCFVELCRRYLPTDGESPARPPRPLACHLAAIGYNGLEVNNITLLNDVLFKVVFGSQRHSEALRGLLNAILNLQGAQRITEITILNPLREKERLEDKETVLHSTYHLYDKEHERTLGDLLELHYLEMCKFKKMDVAELSDSLERWLFFLRQATNYTEPANLPESLMLEEGMTTAMEATHTALSDEEVRYAIEARQKWERDRITQMNAAVEEGEARGEVRGEARGEARGKAEIARALLESGQSEEFILKHTGLRPADL